MDATSKFIEIERTLNYLATFKRRTDDATG